MPTESETPHPALLALFEARTVMLFGEINAAVARQVTGELLALAALGDRPIRMIINSPGGHVESADTIHDAVRFLGAPVYVFGTGWVASAGALVYVAAQRERRYALPNTRFMLHQPTGGVGGPASDIEIEARQVIDMRDRLNRTFARETGQPHEKIARDTDRNLWMSAQEAKAYGLVHHIVETLDVPTPR